jgi:homoserine dehydrogenase
LFLPINIWVYLRPKSYTTRTESYQDNPITIIGAGAGAEVTARGVFGDILRIAENK